MSKEVFDDALDHYYDSIDKVYECAMCGTPMSEDSIYCSATCHRADER
jgi:hypothetical protein